MNKFFLMTRGRTGSTVILDELNRTNGIWADTELFLDYEFPDDPYEFLTPFNLWRKRFLRQASTLTKAKFYFRERALAERYLAESEGRALDKGTKSFGFKLLSHHFVEKPYLVDMLLARNYSAIYLRRNVARQVLSGMVANQRKVYNTISRYEDPTRYIIDLDTLQGLINSETVEVEKDIANLSKYGFDHIVVTYEEFCQNRSNFFNCIFNFLGASHDLPPKSNYSVMIKDLSQTIENYQDVLDRIEEMGLELT